MVQIWPLDQSRLKRTALNFKLDLTFSSLFPIKFLAASPPALPTSDKEGLLFQLKAVITWTPLDFSNSTTMVPLLTQVQP